MISKTIIAGLVAIAFVAGSMITVTADAKKDDKHFTEFFDLLMILEAQIISMQSEIIALSIGGTGGTGPQGIQGETGQQGIQGEQGIQGPSGTGGTGSSSVQFFTDTRTAQLTTPLAGINILSNTFTLDNPATVLITGQVFAFTDNSASGVIFANIQVEIDGVIKQRSAVRFDPETLSSRGMVPFSWIQTLSAGTHTVDIETVTSVKINYCGYQPASCQLNILAIS